jgi:hypothetical protein
MLMEKSQSVFVNERNRDKYANKLPGNFKQMVNTDNFFASSVLVNRRPIGMMYADCHSSGRELTKEEYAMFKLLCSYLSKGLKSLSRQS